MGGEGGVGAGELLEGEAGPLDDDVVDGGLEAGGCDAGDVVVDLIEAVADREAGGDLGDGKAGGLGGEGGGAGDPGVHLDHEDLLGLGIDGELDVGATGLHPDGADHGDGLVAELLVEVVGEGLLWGDGDGVPGVDPHRVDVLDRADDHDVVGPIAHHLELELPPADDGLIEQDLPDRRCLEPLGGDLLELLLAASDPPSPAPEGEGGAHDAGQPELREGTLGLVEIGGDHALGHLQPRLRHRLPEEVAVLGAGDGLVVGPDQLHPVLLQGAVVVEGLREVQGGLPAEGSQQGVGSLPLDHLGHGAGQQGLDVGRVGELGIGHDRRRVGVDEDDLVALLPQHLAGLDPGVVELGRLPDHDRTRAEDQDLA